MFDNPKKELERLEQQLLAAEDFDAEDSDPRDEIYDVFDEDEVYGGDAPYEEDELAFSRRSAGFVIRESPYEMDTDRYVPAPKKKGIGGLLFIAFLELLLAAGLIGWWLGWFQ